MNPHILVSVEQVTAPLLESLKAQQVGIELSCFANPHLLDSPDLSAAVARHRDMLTGFDLPVTMHGAFYDLNPAARDPLVLDACRTRVRQSLEVAQHLSIRKVVFHANYVHSNHTQHKQHWTDKQAAFWSEFIPTLERAGMAIHIENTREEDASYIDGIVRKIGHPLVSICYDTGHSHCFTDSKVAPVRWLETYESRLGYVHLHSNHGQFDEHIAYTKGTVDFDGFWEAFTAIDPMPYLIIEVKQREDYLESIAALRQRFPL